MANSNSAGPSNQDDDGLDQAAPNSDNNRNFVNGTASIDMFKEICGINDVETAERLLRESGGNLEAAIHQFFYTHENPEVLENQDNENVEHEIRQRRVQQNVQAQIPAQNPAQNHQIVPQQQGPIITWGHWLRALAMLPFRFFYSTLAECLTFFYNFLFGPPNRRNITDRNRNRRAIQQVQQQNLIQDRMLMRAQQQEYEQALAIDKQKAAERKQQAQQRKEEEQRAQEEARQLKTRRERICAKKEEIAKLVKSHQPSADEPNLVRLRICFPSGTKTEHRFRQQDSLERLFEVAFMHAECPENFSLLTSYPSNLLRCTPAWYRQEFPGTEEEEKENIASKTFAEVGLLTTAVILVQDNDA